MTELRVLVVDDEPDMRRGLVLLVRSVTPDVRDAGNVAEALERITPEWVPHLVVSDVIMGDRSGLDLLSELRTRHPSTQVILVTGYATIELAVEAMRTGAAHFVAKPFDNEEILSTVRRLGEQALVDEEVRSFAERGRVAGERVLVARDPRMMAVLEMVERVAPTAISVLLLGESGTGKELVSRAIHERSAMREKPFLAVNAAALPDTLLESELFGHRKGAFTGADRDREGLFAQANGGTVFLDEVGLMSPAFQGKLLRVLQERTVIPLGSSQACRVDFRLVSATSTDLEERIAAGEFREDLYYRLGVVTIRVPPLRERPTDIPLLAAHFLARYSPLVRGEGKEPPALTPEAYDELLRYGWPGNVRELENAVQRALVLSKGGEIRAAHLRIGEARDAWSAPPAEDLSYEEGKRRALERFQRAFVERALRRSKGNVSQAAEDCGLTRAALQRIMRSLDLDRTRFLAE